MTAQCPEWWPLPDGQPIGEERARELVTYIRDRSTPVIEIAKAYLKQRYPAEDIKVRESRFGSLARQSLTPDLTGITIGSVSAGTGRAAHNVSLGLERTGRITANLSKTTEPVMRSVSM